MAGERTGGSVALMMVAAGRALTRRVEDELATVGLTLRHYGALAHLSHRPDLSYSDLARRAGITSQSMHATVRALEEQGAVKRSLPGHGHAARLEVTEHGKQLLAEASAAAERLDQELFSGLNEQERDALRAGLMALAPTERARQGQVRGSTQTSDNDGS
jgi:DNA-binding MarR family transcriptional regulator